MRGVGKREEGREVVSRLKQGRGRRGRGRERGKKRERKKERWKQVR